MSTSSRLLETIKDFPEPVIAEIVDFAEFLRQKQDGVQSKEGDVPLISLVGGLENSQSFNDDPMNIQARLRDEWN